MDIDIPHSFTQYKRTASCEYSYSPRHWLPVYYFTSTAKQTTGRQTDRVQLVMCSLVVGGPPIHSAKSALNKTKLARMLHICDDLICMALLSGNWYGNHRIARARRSLSTSGRLKVSKRKKEVGNMRMRNTGSSLTSTHIQTARGCKLDGWTSVLATFFNTHNASRIVDTKGPFIATQLQLDVELSWVGSL